MALQDSPYQITDYPKYVFSIGEQVNLSLTIPPFR